MLTQHVARIGKFKVFLLFVVSNVIDKINDVTV